MRNFPRRAAMAALLLIGLASPAMAACPGGQPVHLGFVPGEETDQMLPIFQHLGGLIAKRLGCEVIAQTGTSYTAVIEAMRAHRIDVASFGAFSYVLAHEVAGAEAVATFAGPDGKPGSYFASITTWPGSGIKTLQDLKGKAFGFADPASTSGHLIPAYGMRKAGLNPDTDIRAFYTGSHTASFEALRNHKIPAAELNSTAIAGAKLAGLYNPADYVTLWESAPIPNGPLAVRDDLNPALKARLTQILQTLDLSSLPPHDLAFLGHKTSRRLAPVTDHSYDSIRDVVSVLHLDLKKMHD
jgi:phosphonate transport system substrate-binding protein